MAAFDDLNSKEKFVVQIKDLYKILEINEKNYRWLKSAFLTLNDVKIPWNVLNKDNEIWGTDDPLLTGVRFLKGGTCIYSYSPFLKDKLYNPKFYAKISTVMQNRFKSKHSLALYELFKDYFDEKRNRGETPFIPLEKFKFLMGCKSGEYQSFKLLNSVLIKKPLLEINKESDLFVDAEYQKEGRKVSAMKFHIKRNKNAEVKVSVKTLRKLRDSGEKIEIGG